MKDFDRCATQRTSDRCATQRTSDRRAIQCTVAIAIAAGACSSSPSNNELQQTLAARYAGDRTGACIAAAVIEGDDVQHATLCEGRSVAGAFEIGSVSKTMTAALLSDLIAQGKIAMNDPIAQYLPAGTAVPTFAEAPIRIAHLVTHTSGLPPLPSRLAPTDPENPYAQLDAAALLASLADVTLPHAPGAAWAYSNFGGMLLSYIVAHVAGSDFEAAARARLFAPLAMDRAFVAHPPTGVVALPGHRSTGETTRPWTFAPELAGVGGVRATLDDMIRYARAHLGRGDAHAVDVLARTHAAVDLGMPRRPGDPEMGMGWLRLPLDGRTVLAHDGGTGGFSSFVAIDPDADRAIVLLADTALSNVGGLDELALHLLDPSAPLSGPRIVVAPPADVLAALAGNYELAGIEVALRVDRGALVAATAEGELRFEYDSHGDFFSHDVDALLTPIRGDDGAQTFAWTQGGAPLIATRR